MTSFSVGNAAYPTAVEIRDQILSDLTYYGLQHEITYNIKPGSDYYNFATSVANRVVVAIANNKISNDARNPLTSEDTALRDIARVYGIEERPASKSSGDVSIKVGGSSTIIIPAGWQGTGPNGKKYVTISIEADVENGDEITMQSVEAGAATVLSVGAQITWDSAAIAQLLNPATVVSGFQDGADTDDNDDIRRRLLDRLAAQAVGGNSASVKEWAEETSASIAAAYVYQAIRGPASLDAAIGSDRGDRTLSGTIVDESRANVVANMPGGVVSINVTTWYPEELDIVLGAKLPLPELAGGTGGGWRDATPWPAEITKITAIGGGPTYTVDSTAAPIVGQSIGLWNTSNPNSPTMEERTVGSVSGSAGAWVITLSGSNTFVAVGDYVSAGATNLVGYAASAYAQFLLLGPGEKTDNPDLLPRSLRYPSPETTGPMDLTARQISEVMNEYDEMSDLVYLATRETGTLTSRTSPSIPPTTAQPPRVLVCAKLAIVRKV
jgi:uncharacterized phage protein gp47/JayE